MLEGAVEVLVRPLVATTPTVLHLLEVIAAFPPGSRTKEEIDALVDDDRSAWDARG